MKCEIFSAGSLFATNFAARLFASALYKDGSDFSKKLVSWLAKRNVPAESDGHIALVFDDDAIVGWARTERWLYSGEAMYDTLEAFVHPHYRLRGIASFAAGGLVSSVLHSDGGTVAVFHPHMLLVARRAGLWPTLFAKEHGRWTQV